MSLLSVARVNGIGDAVPVLSDADLTIGSGTYAHTPGGVDEPQHHLVVYLKDRRAWCWMARDGRGQCRDDERDSG